MHTPIPSLRRTWLLASRLLLGCLGAMGPGMSQAASVVMSSPQGEVGQARQIVVRFDQPVVPLGDPRQEAPYQVDCQGAVGKGQGRWLNERTWGYDFNQDLSPGVRCQIQPRKTWQPTVAVAGKWVNPKAFAFQTGGPTVVSTWPSEGDTVEEEQHWVLQLSGPAQPDSVRQHLRCSAEGLGESQSVSLITGKDRAAVGKAHGLKDTDPNWLLVRCQRPLPNDAKVRLTWGAGIAAQGLPEVVTRQPQHLDFQVRRAFTAEFSCEREKAKGPCLPLRPLTLNFSSPVPRELAAQVRIAPDKGSELSPFFDPDDKSEEVSSLSFVPPLPESMAFKVLMPRKLKDVTGRSLANADMFPLGVRTGGMPPLAKFATAPFGVIELNAEPGQPPLLPLTVRHVEAQLKVLGLQRTGNRTGKSDNTGMTGRTRTLNSDLDIMQWMAKVQRYHESSFDAQELGLPAAQWYEWLDIAQEDGTVRKQKVPRRIGSRELSLLKAEASTKGLQLPPTDAKDTRPFEVIGLPLPGPGYHVVEIESPRLGASLLAKPAPMYVRTGVLATNLGVHIKHGRDSSAVWVTTLDKARPVEAADIQISDCHGKPLWQGKTNAQGLARINQALDAGGWSHCIGTHGLFVSARKPIAEGSFKGQTDLAFAWSSWQKGIETWRFNQPTAGNQGGLDDSSLRMHTVTDRALFRAGETVSMKHFMRQEVLQGLAQVKAELWPNQLKIVHQGSGDEVTLPLQWRQGGAALGSALSSWQIPPEAKLGVYEINLVRKDARGEWPVTSGRFRVEEFRLPMIKARLSTPKGTLVSPKELPINVQMDYLSGGAFSQASARMSAVLTERWVRFDAYDEFSFSPPRQVTAGTTASGDNAQALSDGEPADQGKDHHLSGGRLIADAIALVTDRQGAAKVVLPKLPAIKQPMSVRAELSFNDPNGEVQTAATEVPLWPSEVLVGIKAGSWASNRGQVKFQALAVDTTGKPLKGQSVQVMARLTQEISTRKRIVGGFYSYDNRTEVKELGKVCNGKTDDRGLLLCEATIEQAGQVELIAQGKDAQGHATEAATTVWITKQGELWFSQDNDDRMDVLPEKKQYEPGETARLQVRMPFREATVLVSVEREGVIDTRVMTLTGDDPTIELPIPKTQSWAPNVFVSVMAVRGRLNEVPWYSFFTWGWRTPVKWWQAFRGEGRDFEAPTALVDLSRPAFKLGVAQLKIGRALHELKVEVLPAKDKFGTRDTARARVRVTQNGKPVQGEVAFAAVDEALLSLADNDSWQLLDHLLQERSWRVETGTAQNEIVGRRHYGRKALPAGGGGGGSNTRELFDTLLLWRGDVALNAQGEAVLDVPLNDSLTSFRLVAIANGLPSGHTQEAFGMGSTSIRVTQDLQMLPGLPPLVRQGDQFEAIFTLRNTTATPLKVRAELSGVATPEVADGLPAPTQAALILPAQNVTVPADGATEVRWSVSVPMQTKALQWQASAVSSTAVSGASKAPQDRVKIEQKVQTAVPIRVWAATLQQLEGSATVPVAAPPDASVWATAQGVRPRGGVLIGVQPRLTGALPGLRRYFETYPFVCLEQKTSKAVGLGDAALWAEVSKTLNSYLDADGLALYFPPKADDTHRGHDHLTAYVLSATHEAGFELPEQAREAMLSGLSLFVQGKLQRDAWVPSSVTPGMGLTVRKLAALSALARHGRAEARMLDSLSIEPQRWPTAAVIDWLRVLQALPAAAQREARMSEAENVLRSRLTYAGTTLKFSTEGDDFWWWFMENADANAAKLILAVMDRPSWKEDLPRMVAGSLGRQKHGAWMTTTANLWGALALDKFAKRFESVPISGETQASLGTSSSRLDWASSPEGGRLSLPWPVQAQSQGTVGKPPAGGAPLQVQQVGTGKPWLTVQTLVAVPLKAPLAAGYRLQREVKLVVGDSLKPLPAGPLPRGSILRVSLTIDAQSDMTWVALSDPIPGGATVLGSGLGGDSALATGGEQQGLWPVYVERSFEAWRGYFDWVPKGQHRIDYTVRLNNPGRFQMPPSRIEAMYSPETFGELPNAVVEVKP